MLRYYIPSDTKDIRDMPKESIGVIRTPKGGHAWGIRNGFMWVGDNGAYTGKFNRQDFLEWLDFLLPYQDTCQFVVAPDVMKNPIATMNRYKRWYPKLKLMGYPVAFVAQDGQELFPFPDEMDWLFIGGSTEWKLGVNAAKVIARAYEMGIPIHVGRVNSLKRTKHFAQFGATSFDGTHWIYEPTAAKRRILTWVQHVPSRIYKGEDNVSINFSSVSYYS